MTRRLEVYIYITSENHFSLNCFIFLDLLGDAFKMQLMSK